MKVEILAGRGIKHAFKALGIEATKTYHGKDDPHYEVWEIDKADMKTLEDVVDWPKDWGWWRFAKGSNLGTPFEFLTINGQFVIGWPGNGDKTEYDTLVDYFCQALGGSTETNVCALAVHLARANGMTLAKLFSTCQG